MAGELSIEWTPLDAPSFEDPAVAATWAKLEVFVTDDARRHCLTEVLDRHARTERNEVYGTVLPLAEWIARSWHHLFSSRRAPPAEFASRRDWFEWSRNHSWRNSGDGAALPDVKFVRLDEAIIELRWEASRGDCSDEFERVLFRSVGVTRVVEQDLARSLADFVESVMARLAAKATDSPRVTALEEYWRAARDERAPVFSESRFAARLGLHWWTLDETRRVELARIAAQVTNPVARAGVELADLEGLLAWCRQADEIWSQCTSAGAATAGWDDLRAAVKLPREASRSTAPWHRGWEAARVLRDARGFDHGEPVDARMLMREVGAKPIDGSDPRLRSVVGWSAGRRPVVAQFPGGKSFAMARDLYPLLFRGNTSSDFACILSPAIRDQLPVANAFATELIAPIERVRNALGAIDRVDAMTIDEVAAKIGAPYSCVQHQIENHRLAEIA